jgi:hypothetical protein
MGAELYHFLGASRKTTTALSIIPKSGNETCIANYEVISTASSGQGCSGILHVNSRIQKRHTPKTYKSYVSQLTSQFYLI